MQIINNVKAVVMLALTCFSFYVHAEMKEKSQLPDASGFTITYGAWSTSPTQVGVRDINLTLLGTTIETCSQESFITEGELASQLNGCDFIEFNQEGAMQVNNHKAMEILYKNSGVNHPEYNPTLLDKIKHWFS